MSSASSDPLVHSTGLYDPNDPLTESFTHESMTLRSHPSYLTKMTSLAARDSKLDMSVASHSMMNGRSAFFGLHLFCPANDWLMPVVCTSVADLVPGATPPPPPPHATARNPKALKPIASHRFIRHLSCAHPQVGARESRPVLRLR